MKVSAPDYCVTIHSEAPVDWDDFILSCEPSHFEQTSWWGRVESEDGWSSRFVIARREGRIAGGAMVLVRCLKRMAGLGYLVRGPLVGVDQGNSEDLRKVLAEALRMFARRERLAILTVVSSYDGEAMARTFQDLGFLHHSGKLPPSNLMQGTVTVDLRRKIEDIKKGLRRTLHQEINQAEKKGLTVEPGGAGDLECFWRLHMELCQRRGVRSNVSGLKFVQRAWQEFYPRGKARLFNARLGEDVLCSLMCLGSGKWFYAWRIGSSNKASKIPSSQITFWRAMQRAAEEGYHFFDFMQIDPEEAAGFARGEQVRTPTAGMTFFKIGFGGDVKVLPPTLDWFPNPILRLFMRGPGGRLLSSRYGLKLMRRFWR